MSHQSDSPIQSISLVLPAYNESAAIEELARRAAGVLAGLRGRWSIIVIDDGSTDDTADRVEALAGEIQNLSLVRHEVNRGLGPALVSGLMAALEQGAGPERLVVFMDADLTHPPETIGAMIEAAEAGADLVIASRFQPGSAQVGVPAMRRLMSWGARRLFALVLRLPGVRDYTCGFRGYRASLLATGIERHGRDGLITRRGFACTDELLVNLAALGPRIREVPFVLRYDLKPSPSKMPLGSTILETLKVLVHHRKGLKTNPRS